MNPHKAFAKSISKQTPYNIINTLYTYTKLQQSQKSKYSFPIMINRKQLGQDVTPMLENDVTEFKSKYTGLIEI
uniref:Putative ovule protein n=1 Tax=Solanum chacoense TaxID=4108 RepID=A0A0V0IRB1_SOLCH